MIKRLILQKKGSDMVSSKFIKKWNAHTKAIEGGFITQRKSSRVSVLPLFERGGLFLNFDLPASLKGRPQTKLKLAGKRSFEENSFESSLTYKDARYSEDNGPIFFDGLKLAVNSTGHAAKLSITGEAGFSYKITLNLKSAALAPVLSESSLLRSVQRNMSADEVAQETATFAAAYGADIEIASTSSLEIIYENTQPGRDAIWRVTLRTQERPQVDAAIQTAITQVTHAPFLVSQILPPQFDPEAGTILAQWSSDDADGPQWRFAVETVSLRMMAQSIGESMERGKRFRSNMARSPTDENSPINFRFSRTTELTVQPSRRLRRYTVHPGDVLSALQDAQLNRLVTEMAYPLEVTYQRTPEAKRTILISELGKWLGQPAISLPAVDSLDSLEHVLRESMSPSLADWFYRSLQPLPQEKEPERVDQIFKAYTQLRMLHLANRASYRHRVAQFPIVDAQFPERSLNLREGLSARLRNKEQQHKPGRGAAEVYPLPYQTKLAAQDLNKVQDFVPDTLDTHDTATWEDKLGKARSMPVGLINTIEFASELGAVLGTPVTEEVELLDLTLSVLGATGAMKAAFDEGRTVFEVQTFDGQQSRLVKTRVGRIGVAWNKARHVVIYERSTVPGAQFESEQTAFIGRPLIRKMHEYIEILEPQRLFSAEAAAEEHRAGCLHSFGFASKRIYVNSAWGRDCKEGDRIHGYEIPLFNPDDRSGFYTKPWLGPVAESGSDELVRHWHEYPQDVYFYSNTEAGTGADTDLWEAKLAVDFDPAISFGNIATGDRAPGKENLALKTVPSYTLDAASNPRFAMRVSADGPSNIAHGRGKDKLVAALRTIQIERTGATSRLAFDVSGPLAQLLQSDLPKQVWTSAKGAAEVKSIEATIARIMQDATALHEAFGSGDIADKACAAFKARLTRQVVKAFKEAQVRLGILDPECPGPTLTDALKAISPDDIKNLAQARCNQILDLLTANLEIPSALVDAACSHASAVIDNIRARISQMADVTDVAAKKLVDAIDNDYLALGLKPLFVRAAHALNAPLQLINAANSLEAQIAGTVKDIITPLDSMYDDLQGVIGQSNSLKTEVIKWLDEANKRAANLRPKFDDALNAITKLAVQKSMRGPQQSFLKLITFTRLGFESSIQEMAVVKQDIAGLNIDEIKVAVRDRISAPYLAWRDQLNAAVTKLTEAISPITIELKKAQVFLVNQQTALSNGSYAGLDFKLEEVEGALRQLKSAVDTSPQLIQNAKTALDMALIELSSVVSSVKGTESKLAQEFRVDSQKAKASVNGLAHDLANSLEQIQSEAKEIILTSATALRAKLTDYEKAIKTQIELLDCDAWENFVGAIKQNVDDAVNAVRDQVANAASTLLDDDTRQRVENLRASIKNQIDNVGTSPGAQELVKAYNAIAPKASKAVKLVKLLSEPPVLPQITINSERIEYVFDDVKTQIETSPFVARLRELDAGLKELGLAIPSRQILDKLIPDDLEGVSFNDIVRQAGIDFEDFLKKFKLPKMPSNAIKFSHHVDAKKRTASAKAEIDHQFSSTEQLFDIASFSLDISKPRIKASTNFDISENEAGKAQTRALFGGDWILNFGGQPLVTFRDANVQYSDSGGFKFDLDPSKVEPHPSLKFISDIFKAMMPKLPESVRIVKDAAGNTIGAKIEKVNAIGPYNFGALFIGKTVLASGFGLRMDSGRMKLDASFKIGDTASPVFMQIGLYGGGGWLTARTWMEVDEGGALKPQYAASIGVSLGSARAFTLANVATGTYAMRIFIEATFASSGGNYLVAGLSVSGSARILNYLNAHLFLLLQVEHKDGGSMKGTGQLDIEIEVCWCYSVRISRSIQQDL